MDSTTPEVMTPASTILFTRSDRRTTSRSLPENELIRRLTTVMSPSWGATASTMAVTGAVSVKSIISTSGANRALEALTSGCPARNATRT